MYAAFALPVDDGYVDISIVLYALVVVVLHSVFVKFVFFFKYFSLVVFTGSFCFVSVFFSTFQFVSRWPVGNSVCIFYRSFATTVTFPIQSVAIVAFHSMVVDRSSTTIP